MATGIHGEGDRSDQEPIAVVGVGCRLPGDIASADAFWQMLVEGGDCIGPVPADRWNNRRFYDPDQRQPGKSRVQEAGFLSQPIDTFDAAFWGLPPAEASMIDPRHWLLLESAWEAFEDAGLRPADTAGQAVGVFIGMFLNDSLLHRMGPMSLSALDGPLSRSSSQTMLAARLAHFFDLRGPALCVDTACSGSLVAAHLACQSLWTGESRRAVVGGVNLLLRPEPMIVLDKGGFLNPEARCRSFDAKAGGYVRSEGATALVLEPLSVARAAGRRIYGLIRASGCNNDGRTPGITVPSVDAQVAVLEGLFARSGVSPAAVDFVEAHGTGTPVGDPMEIRALDRVLAAGRGDRPPCWVSSVKSNLGHLEAAAGVAGLLKACLSLRHGQVPPVVHFQALNPEIDLSSGALAIADRLVDFPGGGPQHALVNSFGYGGTNAAMLLEAPPPDPTPEPAGPESGPVVVPVMARSEWSRAALAGAYADWLEARPELGAADLARAVHGTREAQRFRGAVVAEDRQELLAGLRALAAGQTTDDALVGTAARDSDGPVFVYTGMGAQTWGMAEALMATPLGRETLAECSAIYRALSGDDLRQVFDPTSALRREPDHASGTPMRSPRWAQPANLVVQVALTRTWRALGVAPVAAVGHSVGEVAAAWAAGVIDLPDALRIIAARAQVLSRLEGQGTMMAVAGDLAELAPRLDRPELDVRLATWNSHRLGLAAGPRASLASLAQQLEGAGARCTFVPVAVPYHHPAIEAFGQEFRALTAEVRTRPPSCAFFSTWSGARLDAVPDGAEHWWRACAEPVRLDRAVEQLRDAGHRVFLELGPHPTVLPSVVEGYASVGERVTALASLRRQLPDGRALARARARLFVRGDQAPEPSGPADPRLLDLPRYPWERQRHSALKPTTHRFLHGTDEHPFLQTRDTGPRVGWQSGVTVAMAPYLEDHQLGGRVIFPGAGFIEGAAAMAREVHGTPVELVDVRLLQMLDPRERSLLMLAIEPATGDLRIHSSPPEDETDWVLHVTGRAVRGGPGPAPNTLDWPTLQQICVDPVDLEGLYDHLEAAGFHYGPTFRTVRQLWRGDGHVLAELETEADCAGFLVHPTLLDGALQTLQAALGSLGDRAPFVPFALDRLRLAGPLGPRARLHGRFERIGDDLLVGHLVLATPEGEPVAVLDGLHYQRLRASNLAEGTARLYLERWEAEVTEEAPVEEPVEPAVEDWLLLEAPDGAGAALAAALIERGQRVTVQVLGPECPPAPETWAGRSVVVCCASALPSDPGVRPLAQHGWLSGGEDPAGRQVAVATRLCRELARAEVRPARVALWTDRGFRINRRDGPVDPCHRALWGLFRVLPNELLGLPVRRVDGPASEVAAVCEALLRDTDECELACREGGVLRHRLVTRRWADRGPAVDLPGDAALRLAPGQAGLQMVQFEECRRAALAPDEVECRVWLAGLNFKDVMKAQHRLPLVYMDRSYSGRTLGLEFVGEVVRVGSEVGALEVGEAVFGIAPGALASFVRCPMTVGRRDGLRERAPTVFSLPDGSDPTAFVGLVNHLTAWHCLVGSARLGAGDAVLIHSAAGGVGLAAVAIARRIGARVVAAAGTAEKRAWLQEQGVDHVVDSRSLAFGDQVLAATGGRGVDVALGAFTREALGVALGALAPFGRLCHIGKAEILRGEPLSLGLLDGNRTLIAFDLDLAEGEHILYRSLQELVPLLASGELPALPTTIFPAEQADEAFRHLGRGEHIGKVALDLRRPEIPAIRPGTRSAAEEDGAALIVGGLGGLGLSLARWLVARGTQDLVLLGRSGASTVEAVEAVERLRGDARVRVVAADACDRDQLAGVLAEVRADGPPLTAVYHLASVWADGPLSTLEDSTLERVYGTKVHAATSLHDLTLSDPLRHFVLFSSISTLVGNPGQGAYSAANGFLDGLAHHRRAMGLPALAFELGLVGDLGVAADDPELIQRLQARGIEPVAFDEALGNLATLLDEHTIQGVSAGFDWTRIQRTVQPPPRFSRLAGQAEGAVGPGLSPEVRAAIEALRRAPASQRPRLATRFLLHFVAEFLGLEPGRVDPDTSLADMGFDSLMAVEFSVALGELTQARIPTELVTSGGTLRECAVAIADGIAEEAEGGEPAAE